MYIIEHEKSSTDGFIQRDFSYVWLLKQILSESELVIRFKSSMTLISFTYSYEVFLLNNLRLKPILNGDAIWKVRKIFRLIIS